MKDLRSVLEERVEILIRELAEVSVGLAKVSAESSRARTVKRANGAIV